MYVFKGWWWWWLGGVLGTYKLPHVIFNHGKGIKDKQLKTKVVLFVDFVWDYYYYLGVSVSKHPNSQVDR